MFVSRTTTHINQPQIRGLICFTVVVFFISINLNPLFNAVQADTLGSDETKALDGQKTSPLISLRDARSTLTKQSRRFEYSKPEKSLLNKKGRKKWVKKYDKNLSRRRYRRQIAVPLNKQEKNVNDALRQLKREKDDMTRRYRALVNKYVNNSTLKRTTVAPKNNTKTTLKPLTSKQIQRRRLQSVLDIPGVECGKVPIYEKLYHRSINESYEVDPETGDFRILHGLDSTPGEWPWIVRILECLSEDSCTTCTGTLLNDRWVITAGHCAFEKSPEKFSATFGLYDLISPESDSYSVPIAKMIVHPEYSELNNDLTLMKLAKPIIFSDNVRPACLVPETRNVLEYSKGKRCYTVGYGLIEGMEDAIKLQKLEIRAKEPSDCNSVDLGGSELKPGTVCIGPPPGKIGSSCKGDSGGPNVCYDPKYGSWSIFSTVSYGPPVCDRENGDQWLTVSVDLANYRTWILQTILENS